MLKSDVDAQMKRRLRLSPPKTTFATVSGTRILPIKVPSGSKQCTPSPAAAHTRPASSTRRPSNVPAEQGASTAPPPPAGSGGGGPADRPGGEGGAPPPPETPARRSHREDPQVLRGAVRDV